MRFFNRLCGLASLGAAAGFVACKPVTSSTSAPVVFPNTGNATSDLAGLMAMVNEKVGASLKTEEEMASELRQFDVLLAAHAGDKSNAVAAIAWARAKLLATSLHQPVKALDLYKQIVADYPGTAISQEAAAALPALEKKIDDDRIHRSLAVGTQFPDFSVTDMDGKPLSPSQYLGQVLLIEFWAAWCPDCHVQLPKVMALYNQYHAQGFAVIGISLDEADRNKVTSYLQSEKIPWPQYYDGKYWDNALAVKYGVHFTPQNYLLNRQGVIIGKDLEGDALVRAMQQAMATK
jgi:peroxiredoxin